MTCVKNAFICRSIKISYNFLLFVKNFRESAAFVSELVLSPSCIYAIKKNLKSIKYEHDEEELSIFTLLNGRKINLKEIITSTLNLLL